MRAIVFVLFLLCVWSAAKAQPTTPALRASPSPNQNTLYGYFPGNPSGIAPSTPDSYVPLQVSPTGRLMVDAGGTGGGGGGSGSSAASTPVTPAAPDNSTVTSANTAITAFAAGETAKGGWLFNPSGAAGPLCISLLGAAATTSGGATTCIGVGTSYTIPPTNQAVSVNAADAGHTFSGLGYQ